MMRWAWVALIGGGALGCGAPVPATEEGAALRGFASAAVEPQLALERELASRLRPDSTGAYFRHFTAVPHPAGSIRNRELAEFVAERWRLWGWDEVTVHRYDVLLPWPDAVSVTMVAPRRFEASLREDAYAVDPDSRVDPGPTYLGMSASADVTAELVYANSGNPADYDWLEAQGIDLRGKIAIVRYSNPYSYRGFKALTAERRGLAALLIYSDPAEDGYRRGLVYPEGPWGPESHIQRGAITYDFIVPGDPLTPGWASVDGAPRIPEGEARSIPRIAAVPLSWRDARPLLEALEGPVAPPAWQGALPFTYRVGPGATIRVRVRMDGATRPIWVVEARLRGSERPEELVVLGNHRDAWVYGAVDPSSGTATQMELARVLGSLAREGWRPKRTIVLASWDAEEWHLTGSTEWGEHFADPLREGAVAYLNVDGSTSGPRFSASAVASLSRLVTEVARDVTDPATGRSLLAAWAAAEWGDSGVRITRDSTDLVTTTLGSGSDYTVFLNWLGIPIVDLAFVGPYGVYHSVYDSYRWMTRFGDPGFRYMTVMAEVWGRMALRLANADVIPYDFTRYADRVQSFLDELAAVPGVRERLDLTAARAALVGWREAAAAAERQHRLILARGGPAGRYNDAVRQVERAWLLENGIPGRTWFRHALYAPRETYAAMELPGVREAVDAGDWDRAAGELRRLTASILAVAAATRAAADVTR